MELNAQKRTALGKKTRTLKINGQVPGVVFGKGMESISVVLNALETAKVLSAAGETDLIDLKIDGNVEKVLIKNAQYAPVSGSMIHIELYKPNLKEKTTAQVPVDVIGEDKNALVKSGNAVVLELLSEIEVEALPMDIPHSFIVDISGLANVGDGITVAELNYDKSKVEITGADPGDIVVKLDDIAAEEAVEEVSEEEKIAQMEALKEKKPEDEEEGNDKEKDKSKDKK